jgi:flagellar basal-body rod protein FlgF
MDALIYTALSGADRTMQAQQVRANNLANMDTPGFRANMEVASARSLLHRTGYDDRHQVTLESNALSTRQGVVKATGRDLDVALDGNAYLAVQFGNGEAYTRAGALDLDAAGTLMSAGRPVLGDGGPIVLPQHTAVAIGADGTISVQVPGKDAMQVVDKLKLVRAEGAELTKNEVGLIVSRNGAPLPADNTASLRARHLEGSNVSAVEEMVATMSLNRSFELQMKLYKAADSMTETGNRLIGG